MLLVVSLAEDTDAATVDAVADVNGRVHVFLPDDGEEQGTCAIHDRYVRQVPIFIVGGEGLDDTQEEGVFRNAAHGIVGDAGRYGAMHPSGVGEERVEATSTTLNKMGVR